MTLTNQLSSEESQAKRVIVEKMIAYYEDLLISAKLEEFDSQEPIDEDKGQVAEKLLIPRLHKGSKELQNIQSRHCACFKLLFCVVGKYCLKNEKSLCVVCVFVIQDSALEDELISISPVSNRLQEVT